MTDHPTSSDTSLEDEQPPILGSWRALYLLVIILHFVLIGLLYWFTRTYA